MLDKLVSAGKATMAGQTLAYARSCYSWAAKRGKVPGNPSGNFPSAQGDRVRLAMSFQFQSVATLAPVLKRDLGLDTAEAQGRDAAGLARVQAGCPG